MIVKANRPLNLHSKTYEHTRADHLGLVHVPANQAVKVPDDVEDGSMFRELVDSGVLTVFGKKKKKTSRPTNEQIQEARSQSELKGEERPVLPLEDDDPPLKTSQNQSTIPQAEKPGTKVDDSENGAQEKENVKEENPSLTPEAEVIDEDELDEDEAEEETSEETTEDEETKS